LFVFLDPSATQCAYKTPFVPHSFPHQTLAKIAARLPELELTMPPLLPEGIIDF
jgi:hypothetical protein